MIVSKIIGGLGNQMFEYAAGRALSLVRGQSLRLDISAFNNCNFHNGFELQRVFNCPVEIATEADLSRILGWQSLPILRWILSRPRMGIFRSKRFVFEPHFHYWPELRNVPSDCYLVGYWQSEKYFLDIASVIRKDFTFKTPLIDCNAELAEKISQVNAISLHVRRGDYTKNPKTRSIHTLCSHDYYESAIQYIIERVERPYFFIFSDDITWVKKNLNITFPCQIVDQNRGIESYNDMRLMSMCQHNIIANSTFSWWGAWLNANPNKIVIAPKKWFTKQLDDRDLIPQGWVRL